MLTTDSFKKLEIQTVHKDNMGFKPMDDITEVVVPDYCDLSQEELSEEAISKLDYVVQLCNENNIEIIFYTAPYQGEYLYGDAMAQYAEENGCIYIDMFKHYDEIGIDEKTDFYDYEHLNKYGAKKVADYIGAYIKSKYYME